MHKIKYYFLIALCFISSAAYALGLGLGLNLTKDAGSISYPAPSLASQYDHPYIEWDSSTGEPAFTLEPTPANFANSAINDKWSHWHRMFITVDTTNGYVLGTLPVPASQLGGGSWSLSGTDAALFAIDSSTGQITLADAASVTTEGDLSITVNTPAGGAYAITVPVEDDSTMGTNGSGSYRFYDSDGDGTTYASEGGDVENALNLLEQYSANAKRPNYSYVKRGSVWPNARLDMISNFPQANHIMDYGDPSEPRPHFTIDSGQTSDGAIDEYVTASTPNGSIIEGLDIDINGVTIRGLNCTNWLNITVNRVSIKNNDQSLNSAGFYFNDCDNWTLRHSDTENIYGDGAYQTNTFTSEVGFNKFRQPLQADADGFQASNEGDTDQYNWDVWHHDNISIIADGTTGKGGSIYDGAVRVLNERNWLQTDFFSLGFTAMTSTARHNFLQGHDAMETDEFILGVGAQVSAAELSIYGNLGKTSDRGFSVTGPSATGWQGTEWNRADIRKSLNYIMGATYCYHFNQPHTGLIEQNYCTDWDNAVLADNKGDADYQGTITDISVSGQVMTLTLGEKTHIPPNKEITISGAVNGDNNVSNVKATVLEYNSLQVTAPSGTPVNESGGSITYSATPQYTTKTHRNNIDAAPSYGDMPTLSATPTYTGTVRENETVTCSASVPSGHTATYFWYINGVLQSDMSGASATIPYLTEGIDPRKPNLQDISKDVNYNDLGCAVEIANDTTGYKNLYQAVNSSGFFTTRIQHYIEGLDTPLFWTRPSDLKTSSSVTSLSDKFGSSQTLTEATNPPSIIADGIGDWNTLDFDGSAELLSGNELAAYTDQDGEHTTQHIYFQADSTTGTQVIAGFGTTSSSTPISWFGISGGDFIFIKRDDGGTSETKTIATADTNAHMISIEGDGNTFDVWLDGVHVIDENWGGGIGDITVNTFTLGALVRNSGAEQWFNGKIAFYSISSGELTESQVETAHEEILSYFTEQPSKPLSLDCTGESQQISCVWFEPTLRYDEITDYKIEYDCGGGYSTFADGTSTDTVATITGLTNGIACTIRVSATNDNGYGPVSDTDTATPAGDPQTELSDLISGVVACWHGDTYSGSGDWLNQTSSPADSSTQAANDVTPSDTTAHDGINKWDADGVMNFDIGTNTTFLGNLHKTSGGTDWTIISRFKTPTISAASGLLGTADAATDYGIALRVDSGGDLKLDQYDGTTLQTDTGGTLSDNTYYTTAVKYDTSEDDIDWAINASSFTGASCNGTSCWTGSVSSAASYALKLASEGNGGSPLESGYELYAICITNTDMSDADLATAVGWIEGRYPAAAPTAPDAPVSLVAQAGSGEVYLAWDLWDNGGAPVTDYVVEQNCGGAGWSTFADGTSTNKYATVTSLSNDTSCDFRVSATNSVGTGSASSTATDTPEAEGTNPYDETEYKLTLPVNSSGERTGNAAEILSGSMSTYESAWFGRVDSCFEYNCVYPGATTATATFSRSELRGTENDKEFNYDDDSDETLYFAMITCPVVGSTLKQVVEQIHDADEPVYKVVYDCKTGSGNDQLRILINEYDGQPGDTTYTLKTGITLGDYTKLRIFYDGDGSSYGGQQTLAVWIDDTLVLEQAMARTGANDPMYRKRGLYCQLGPAGSVSKARHCAAP